MERVTLSCASDRRPVMIGWKRKTLDLNFFFRWHLLGHHPDLQSTT